MGICPMIHWLMSSLQKQRWIPSTSQPLHMGMLYLCPGPAQPPVSAAFRLPKCRICLFWSPQKSPLGLRGQEGTALVIPKPRGPCACDPGLLRLV